MTPPALASATAASPRRAVPVPATLVDAIRASAAFGATVTMVDEMESEIERSWAELYAGAERRAAALHGMGVKRGEPVVIVLDSSFEFIEVFMGCLLAGAVPTPAYPPTAMARLDGYIDLLANIARATRATTLISDRRILGAIASVRRKAGLTNVVDVARLDAEPCLMLPPNPDELGLIQCTSGSTSAPKPVALRHRNLIANVIGMADRYNLGSDDVVVSWLPLYHDLGLIGQLLACMVMGAKLVIMSPATFLMDPGTWWRAVSRHHATMTAAPSFAFGLSSRRLDAGEIASLDLSSLKAVISGAEPVQPATIHKFLSDFAPAKLSPGKFCPAYGLAESCVGVTGAEAGRGLHIDRVSRRALEDAKSPRAIPCSAADAVEVVGLGTPYSDSAISIRNDAGKRLADRMIGEVFIQGTSVMAGYLHKEEATREAFLGDEFRTGDLGYMVDGELFLVGRRKHMLIVRGRNYYAEAIETVVEEVRGVRKGNAVAFGVFDKRRGSDRLWLVCETRIKDKAKRAELTLAIEQAVTNAVGISPAKVVLLAPNTIPKTSSGKKQRHACRDMVQDQPARGIKRKRATSGVMTWIKSQVALAEMRLQRAH